MLAANDLTDAYVRPIAWRGTEMLSVAAQQTTIHLAIAAWPWPSYFGAERMAGIRLGMGAWKRPSPETAPTMAKATGLYMIGTMSKHEAEAEGFNDALLLDWRGSRVGGDGCQHLPGDGRRRCTRRRRIVSWTASRGARSWRWRGAAR